MLKKPKVAILGSGAGFSGFIYGLTKLKLYDYELDHYQFNKNLQVKINDGLMKTSLPSSVPYGGLSLWGGVLGFNSYEEYMNSPIWDFLNIKVSTPINESNNIVLAAVETKKFFKCFKQIQKIAHANNKYKIISKNISMFKRINNFIYLYDMHGKLINKKYDKLIICLGPIQTPRLLHASGYLDKKINLHDNTMKLIPKPSMHELDGIYDYSNIQPQYTKSKIDKEIKSHFVKVASYYKFNSAETFNKAYWVASGKSQINKLYAGIKILLPAMIDKSFIFTRLPQDNVFKVESDKSAMVSLEFNKKTSNITWRSKDKLSVSAFHLHNSISADIEDGLENMNIIISDASVIRNLNGINPLAKIFKKSFLKSKKI